MAPLYSQRNEVGPWLPCVRGAVRRSGLRGCPLGVRGKGKGPAGPFPSLRTEPALRAAPVFRMAYSAPTAHCAVSSETLMLQVRCANPPMPHRTSSSSCSGVPVGLLSYLRAIPPFGALAFRSAYWLSPHHPALRRAGVPFGLLAVSAPSRLTACWRSVRLIGCAKRSNSSRFATYGKPKRSNSSRFATYGKPKRRTPVASRPTASSNARPSGSLRSPSDAAPNQLFKPLRCSAWLIFLISPSSECSLNRFKGSP